jgi:hypothetical protein
LRLALYLNSEADSDEGRHRPSLAFAVEGNGHPIHQLAIVAMGLPLIDVMDLEAVAQVAQLLVARS